MLIQSRNDQESGMYRWELSPFHPSLPGPMRLKFRMDGEHLFDLKIVHGMTHKGLEKTAEYHPWQTSVFLVDHVDPINAAFYELGLCLAVEEIGDISVPVRASSIRIVLCELTRVANHLNFIVSLARSMENETIIQLCQRDREKVLDLIELLTGGRFACNFLRYGGVAKDVTEGFVERVLELREQVLFRMKEYNDLFTYSAPVVEQLCSLGVLSQEQCNRYQLSGPNARASGLATDIRKSYPYSHYDKVDFEIPTGKGEGGKQGAAHDRLLVRLREIGQSLDILGQVLERLPQGDFYNRQILRDFSVPSGEAYSKVEGSRGSISCYIVSEGGTHPSRIQFGTPSSMAVLALPEICEGIHFKDLSVLLASMAISISEIDR